MSVLAIRISLRSPLCECIAIYKSIQNGNTRHTKYKEVWAIRTSLRVPLCVLTVTSSWICVDTYLVYKCRYIDSKLLLAIQNVLFNANVTRHVKKRNAKLRLDLRVPCVCLTMCVCVCISKKCHQELENALYYRFRSAPAMQS